MPSIAIVHDWLTGMRGGEKCLEVFCELFPEAHLYTLLHVPGTMSAPIRRMKIHTSLLQSLPFARKKYRYYLPLMPWMIEKFDLSGYDLVLSSSHCVAKGVTVGKNAKHVCYCYSPMRYIWDQYDAYFGKEGMGGLERLAMPFFVNRLRKWDRETAKGVDRFIAISRFVAERIKKYYGREADIIHPPVNASFYLPEKQRTGDYFLMVTALAPYKRVDLAIRVFNQLKLPLRIIGSGQMEGALKKMAGPTVRFLGWRSDEEVRDAYANCRALIFPGEEDFGIVPLEAQSCGRPVIAYGSGGVLETVLPANPKEDSRLPGPATGLFFYRQDAEALEEAVVHFQKMEKDFDPEAIRQNALRFDREKFLARISDCIKDVLRP